MIFRAFRDERICAKSRGRKSEARKVVALVLGGKT